MKSNKNQSNKNSAFTIVELLTVMSIIVILIGLLVPALAGVKRYAKKVKQMAQFHSIDSAIELFNNDFDGYPPSGALDLTGQSYCGAMKLCEAMMGWDLLGFHTNSVFRADGKDATGSRFLYDPCDLSARRGPFLPPESANAYRIQDIYTDVGPFLGTSFVLCDVYTQDLPTGVKAGMPILYYKANTANNLHYPTGRLPLRPDDAAGNIYNFWDNQELIELGKPWVVGGAGTQAKQHALADPRRFYKNTKSDKIQTAVRPYRADSYILISAGFDREYGTADDICNFEWKYRE